MVGFTMIFHNQISKQQVMRSTLVILEEIVYANY